MPTLLIALLEDRSRRRFLAERQGRRAPAPARPLVGRPLLLSLPGLLALAVVAWCVLEQWAYLGRRGSDLRASWPAALTL